VFKQKEAEAETKPKEAKPVEKRRAERRDTAVRKGTKSQNRVIRYFQETGDELRKVAWPSRETTIRLTLMVLGVTLAFALGLGLLDLLFQRLAALLAAA
jgi:preprotein translocase subunit SecE